MPKGWSRVIVVIAATALTLLFAAQAALGMGSGSFTQTGSMTTQRSGLTGAALPGGSVLAAGGYNGSILQSAEVFNPALGTFSSAGIGTMTTPRTAAGAAPLTDGRVLIAGGLPLSALNTAETFNPATGGFTAVAGAMTTSREEPTAARLGDGRVLLAGGYDPNLSPPNAYLRNAEVFNPGTNGFSTVAQMGTRRDFAAAAPLQDGRVLVVGGDNASSAALATAEVYNPASNSWSAAGSMGTPRSGASAAPLPDGRVLVVGGNDGGGQHLSSAEVFNPATNSFSSAGIGPLSGPRSEALAAPLADGRVLVAGGAPDNIGFLSSAEIYSATNAFSFSLKGKKLIVSIQATGTVSVSDAGAPLRAGKKKKRKLLLKPSSASGDPPSITVPLKLSKQARKKLKQAGKVKVKARIVFTPQGGVAKTRTAKLKIKR